MKTKCPTLTHANVKNAPPTPIAPLMLRKVMATVPLVRRFAAMDRATPLERTDSGKISEVTTHVTGPIPSEKLAMKKQSAVSVTPADAVPAPPLGFKV